eukprot:jgi/Chlat1/4867/Chrsp31S04812
MQGPLRVKAREETAQPTKTHSMPERQGLLLLHVRALNTQFQTWVAQQATKHGDELWVDGVRDYLKHADKLRADFSSAAERDTSAHASAKPPLAQPFSWAAAGATTVLANDVTPNATAPTLGWSFNAAAAPPADSKQSINGNGGAAPQPNAPSATDASQEEEEQPEQPPSPSLRETNMDGEDVTHSVTCKIYAMVDRNWKEVGGMGQLSLRKLKDKELPEAKPRLVFRNNVGKVLLNAAVYTGMKLQVNNKSLVTHLFTAEPIGVQTQTKEDGDAPVEKQAAQVETMVTIRTKGPEDVETLATKIKEIMPPVRT